MAIEARPKPFEEELAGLADEIGLSSGQQQALARFFEQQVNDLLDTCIEIVADEENDQ